MNDANMNAILSALQNGGSLAEVNNGGMHEQNPNGGVPIGQNATVEEGESIMGDFVYSDRVINPATGNSFSADAKKINKKLGKRKNESFDKKACLDNQPKILSRNALYQLILRRGQYVEPLVHLV